ncbi:MAG: cobyrinate a,c-diamide synthase [Methylobacteriaceae bacterium]|nr:cobyrinate a,c-diamide synthase [Methylobacteriaceae bacterium]
MSAGPPPGLVIAAPRSGSGKTTLALGLLRAFAKRGLRVAGAKCGPDYIDPAFHAAASGRPSFNLDSWAMEPDLIAALARRAGAEAEFILCEGSMGLFDGVPAERGRAGTSADIAAATGWPLLLVLDVSGQAQSAAAVVKGCATYDSRLTIAGVVLNRVGSVRHRRLVGEAIEDVGIAILGALPRSDTLVLPERHLGLVQASETENLDGLLNQLADFVADNVDLGAIQARAASTITAEPATIGICGLDPPAQHIALARDPAFSFIYPHLIEGWRGRGAEICCFSPLADEAPPRDCEVCWLPGGYPELHAGRLAACGKFLDGLRRFADTKPMHGECGGYMVLGEALTDASGATHRMAGLLGIETTFAVRKLHLGYRTARLAAPGFLGGADTRLRGHEFHYATTVGRPCDPPFAFVTDAYGTEASPAGSRRGLVTGSFFHIIAPSS